MTFLRSVLAVLASLLISSCLSPGQPKDMPVNILLVTVDDMNWNSVGAFGNPIENITPNIDQLAREGRRFERAYVAAANCSPSRVALQTGLYPQQSGATGFFYIDDTDSPMLAAILRDAGFLTGVINKTSDTNASPYNSQDWDYRASLGAVEKYAADAYGKRAAELFQRAAQEQQPFYLVVNIADPHKPNFNDPQATKTGADFHTPSRIISEGEVTIPAFLPDLPGIRADVRNYYNSVKRADDVLGAVMAALRESGFENDTLVIFLSDHGMPFPFAKSSVYENGLRTPLLMRWPGVISPDSIEAQIVSAVDIMPTILDAAHVALPDGPIYLGRSLLALDRADQADLAFGSFDENAKGFPVPMRGVISHDWGYAFNAWADGEHTIKVADMNHRSFMEMRRAAQKNPAVADRLDYFLSRSTEELCHLQSDPDCLINLADDPAHADVLEDMQAALRAQMVRTGDYLLEAFDVRNNRENLQAFMRQQHDAAKSRAARLQWKREENIAGSTNSNRELFRHESR